MEKAFGCFLICGASRDGTKTSFWSRCIHHRCFRALVENIECMIQYDIPSLGQKFKYIEGDMIGDIPRVTI